ncbi:MAG: glucokinase, partial [Proteobacteria bacterium]|nr:glucokinase [Pseudomonadota bacterium]
MAARPDPSHRPGLIADIGGTNARFALSEADGSVRDAVVLACRDFPDLAAAAEAFLARIAPPAPPRRAAMAVASPVSGDRVD